MKNESAFPWSMLDTIMRSISDAILAVDTNGNVLFFNSKISVLFPKIDIRKSSKLNEIFSNSFLSKAFENSLNNKTLEKINAIKFELPSGIQYYSLSVSPFYGKNKDMRGAVGIFHDVTELKEAEQIRIDFVANVSHEIRTPLTSIKGYADTLIGDLKTGRSIEPELIEPIVRNCERLENITRDLLDLSILDTKHSFEKENINLPQLTEKVFKNLENNFKIRKQNASWKCNCILLNGNAHRVEQVLTNLLDNASKYTPVGGQIEVLWFLEGNENIILEVHDNGPGIAQEHCPRLFERFYRVDKGRSRNLGGTGLGLAIVKHIMLTHNGTVCVKSELGKGSVFRCEFPL